MLGANLDYLILRSLAHSRNLATEERLDALYSREADASSAEGQLQPEETPHVVSERRMKQGAESQHGNSAGRDQVCHPAQDRERILDMLERVDRQQYVILLMRDPCVQIAANELHVTAHCALPRMSGGSFDVPGQVIHAGDAPDTEIGNCHGQFA